MDRQSPHRAPSLATLMRHHLELLLLNVVLLACTESSCWRNCLDSKLCIPYKDKWANYLSALSNKNLLILQTHCLVDWLIAFDFNHVTGCVSSFAHSSRTIQATFSTHCGNTNIRFVCQPYLWIHLIFHILLLLLPYFTQMIIVFQDDSINKKKNLNTII